MKAFSAHVLKILCVLPLVAPLAAGAVSPMVLEEAARIAPPATGVLLNGPVALHGDYLIAGSTAGDPNGFDEYIHRAFLFERSPVTGEWGYVGQLFESSSLEFPDNLHFSIDLEENLAAIASVDSAEPGSDESIDPGRHARVELQRCESMDGFADALHE